MSYSGPPPSGGPSPYGSASDPGPQGSPDIPLYGTPPPLPPLPGPGQAASFPPPGQPGYGQPPSGEGYGTAPAWPSQQPYDTPVPSMGPNGWTTIQDNGKGSTSLSLGIAGVLLCAVPFVSLGLGIGAIVVGTQGRTASTHGTATNGGVATAGLVLGIVSVVLNALVILGQLAGAVDG